MSEDSRDQLNCLLIWAILKPRGAVTVLPWSVGGKHGGLPLVEWQDISSSGLATKTLIFFI